MPTRNVLLLRDEIDRDAIDDAMLAGGLVFVHLVPATAAFPWQLFAELPDRSASAVFVEDHRLGVAYAIVDGAQGERVAGVLRGALSDPTEDEPSDLRRALALRVVEGSSQAALPLLKRALWDAELEMQLHACRAAAYLLSSADVLALLAQRRAMAADSHVVNMIDELFASGQGAAP